MNLIRNIVLPLVLATASLIAWAQPGGGPPRRPSPAATFATAPQAKDEAEKKILDVLDELDRAQRRGTMSVPRDDGRLLRLLAESLAAKHVVELGTSHGYSSIWFCLALRTTAGKLTTFEIDAQRAATARENFQRAGVSALVTLIEGDAHEQVTKVKDPIDLIFLDADKTGYEDYLKKLLPLLRPGGLVVAHNIDERSADPGFIKAITADPALDSVFVNAGSSGLSVSLKKR
jgi:caffeoyl-CoA O-methyltransferase